MNIKGNVAPAVADMCVWPSREFTYTLLRVALQPDTVSSIYVFVKLRHRGNFFGKRQVRT